MKKRIASGCIHIRGYYKIVDTEFALVDSQPTIRWNRPIDNNMSPFLAGTASRSGLKVGGTTDRIPSNDPGRREAFGDYDLVSYRTGFGDSTSVVYLQPGTTFIIVLACLPDAMTTATLRTWVLEPEEELLPSIEKLYNSVERENFEKRWGLVAA